MNEENIFEGRSLIKLSATIGFMFFLYLNLLAGGVITIALLATLIRMVTGV